MRWLRRLGLALLASLIGPLAVAKGVLIITTSPAQPGRFVALEHSAEKLGLPLRSRFVEKIPSAELGPALWQGADLVLIDAPRQHIEDAVRAKLGAALPALSQVPHLWLPTSAARAGGGLDPSLAQRLHAYFVQGGPANTEALLLTLKAHLQGQDWRPFAPPFVYPSVGLYHPSLPQGVVGTAKDYWRARQLTDRPGQPVIGIAFHQGSLASGQTAVLDDLIGRIESQGAIALPFYSPVMEADAMHRALSRDGRLVADVLINTQITLNPEGRRKEFEGMGIPVVQAMPWRKGSAAQWQADPHGIPLMDVPFYLAQAEYAGITDIQIAMATQPGDEQLRPIPTQSAAVVAKALNLARLRHTPAQEKRVAIFFWNYPAGEKNLSASFMNLPRSLEEVLQKMAAAGYRTQALPEAELLPKLQALLAPGYRPAGDQQVLRQLLRDDLADRLPVRQYNDWLASLPPHIGQALRERWGPAEHSSMVLRDGSAGREESVFVIPRLQLGAVTLLPQPGRDERGGDKEKALYHSTSALPTHHYLATYLWARQSAAAHALVHFGTHGTQEWLPGKERGLSVHDWPLLAVGDTPVFYPYIVDNIGEATQAKRRGRAVIISHQTPPLTPAGLHDRLTQIHDLLHQWLSQDEGEVRQQIRKDFLARVHAERIALDMGWTPPRINADFEGFVSAVHDHLHELALTAQPMGLHTFGRGSGETHRIAQVLMMLGPDFWEGVADPHNPAEEADELLITDYKRLPDTKPYRLLAAYLREGQAIKPLTPAAQKRLALAHTWYEALGAKQETQALLDALEGRHIPTSYGGDPLKNPDALPTGRNLYGFDPSRVPTKAAWDAGKLAFDQLLATHRKETGRALTKASFTLWSVETMRHFGLLEAQALWALGVEPVWDSGGRVNGVRLIPRSQLGRPRVDVVLSATGLYRDHFPNVMKQLASAAQLASEAEDEADNPVAANAQRIQRNLMAAGLPASQARNLGATRIFSSASGRYGSGLDDAALATDTWRTQAEGDRKLAELYLSRMQFAYGPDDAQWGSSGAQGFPQLNLYAEHLRGTQAAVLSRTSNLYGMLTTDDPFQYLGGMSLAVRHLDGQAPALYISNLRGAGAGRVEGAATFLAKELATRNFHPGHIEGLMAEGYAGTLQVLDGLNNFAGWQSVAREVVRHDQWQEFMDVYVRDKHQLGLRDWFEQHNPHALAQSMERMLEAARLQQWKADPGSVAELKQRYRDLAQRFQVRSDNAVFERFVATGLGEHAAAAAKGLNRSRPSAAPTSPTQPPRAAASPTTPLAAPQPEPIRGLKLEPVAAPSPERSDPLSLALSVLALLLCSGGGAARGWRWRAGAPRPTATAA